MNKRVLLTCLVLVGVGLIFFVNHQPSVTSWLFPPEKQPETLEQPKHNRLDKVIQFHDKKGNLISYDRMGAAAWAKEHAYNPLQDFAWCGLNDKGKPDGSADCVNLASQSLHFGGGLPYSKEWHGGATEADCTVAWVSTPDLAEYLKNQEYATIEGKDSPAGYTLPNLENAQEGDLLQWYDPTNGWHHTAVITNIDDEGNIFFSEHSPTHYDRALSTIWPMNVEIGGPGEPYRLIQIGHDVNGKVF